MRNDRPIYTIAFRPEPGVDAIRALRAILKIALRRFGMKALRVNEIPAQRGSQPDDSGELKKGIA
jgi:hypothetical protein